MWRACGQRMALQLATVLIMVTGCSDDSNRLASDSTMEDVAQAVPTESPAPHPVRTTSSENVIAPDVFASMSPKQCLPWVPPERQTGCKPTETP